MRVCVCAYTQCVLTRTRERACVHACVIHGASVVFTCFYVCVRHGVCKALLPKAPHYFPAKHQRPPTPTAPAYITCQRSAGFSHGPSPAAVGTFAPPSRGGTGTGANSHAAAGEA